MALVTDLHWYQTNGELRTGYYLDRWLKQNLDGIPAFLDRAFDVVAIVSGTGKVRLGKSTLALQMAYYVAWIIAGGRTVLNERGQVIQIINPTNEVNFGIDNIVFSPDELKEKAEKLPKHSVIVYDEGRVGLQSDRHMENVNKQVADFFQECGQYGHVIFIVLPDFFKLGVDYATNRSLFLVNVFADKEFNRGYFNFYNENSKEKLFLYGKKKVGTFAKYNSYPRNFWGRFSAFVPVDRVAYEQLKRDALSRKKYKMPEILAMKQRDMMLWLFSRDPQFPVRKLIELFKNADLTFSDHSFGRAITNVERMLYGKRYVPDGWPMSEREIDLEMMRIKDDIYHGGSEVRDILTNIAEKYKKDKELNAPLTEVEEMLFKTIEERNKETKLNDKYIKKEKFADMRAELADIRANNTRENINMSPPTQNPSIEAFVQRQFEELLKGIDPEKTKPSDIKYVGGVLVSKNSSDSQNVVPKINNFKYVVPKINNNITESTNIVSNNENVVPKTYDNATKSPDQHLKVPAGKDVVSEEGNILSEFENDSIKAYEDGPISEKVIY